MLSFCRKLVWCPTYDEAQAWVKAQVEKGCFMVVQCFDAPLKAAGMHHYGWYVMDTI